MSVPEPCFAPPVWTGPVPSMNSGTFFYLFLLMCCRVKDKLRNGEMVVSGDNWPIFLYYGYNYDAEDPWNGLFRSALLVSVGPSHLFWF